MASWIYSLVRSMAANRDESNPNYSSHDQGSQDQYSQEQKAENAEHQELRTKLRTREAQVLEMAMLMLTLKSNGMNENATVAARANHENGPLDYPATIPQERNKYQCLEETLRTNARWMMTHNPSLVPNEISSPVFKLPEFVRFEGMTCPALHVDMYYRKMFPLTENEGVLVYHFQNSLTGEALRWYMQLEHAHMMSLKELVCAFLKRFRYNLGMDPDRMQLQHMAQRSKETFREYAHRWRDLAAQVRPPLLEGEMVDIFMNTLPPLYYDGLIGNAHSDFESLVLAGESLESNMRIRKTANGSIGAIVESENVSCNPEMFPQISHSSTRVRESRETRNYVRRKPEDFDPIPMSYSDLFDHLVNHNLISIRSMKPIQPPFPRSYDPEAKCRFHSGAVGHSVENCKALKHAVQDLIDSKHLNFNENRVNDFRVKKGGETSAMMNQGKLSQYNPSPASYAEQCDFLIGHNVISPRKMKPSQPPFPNGYNSEASCVFHAGAIGHSTKGSIGLSVKTERQGTGVIGSE